MIEVDQKEEKPQIKVSLLAYKKIVYHLIRYPTSKVTGVLSGSKKNQVLNAYPLFHTPIVNPTFSVALDLIESNLPEGEEILGFYQSIEGNDFKVGGLVQNNAMMKGMLSMKVWMDIEQKIKTGSPKFNFICPQFEEINQGLSKGEYRYLVDMDVHLQEIEMDFRNTYLN